MMQSDKLLVKCEEESGTHPHCPHGPMLFFYKSSKPEDGYFACSAFRDKKACGYHLDLDAVTKVVKKRRYPVETYDYKKLRRKIKSVSGKYRNFCHTCNQPYVQQEADLHSDHQNLHEITDEMFLNPTSFLKPLANDKVEAQYFFDRKSLEFFSSCLKSCITKKVICIGAPRLHAYLKEHSSIQSFLLDFDHRYFYFYDDDEFAWYNMCNNYFFDEKQRVAFEAFIHDNEDNNLAIFTDPPFGCRTEVVANSIKQITSLYRALNANQKTPAVFWVYPYFCEAYIREAMPEMDMSDYKINYTNHESYSNGVKGRKLGSPVRLFTNVPLEMVKLPEKEGYKYCQVCSRWKAKENSHCALCGICPSKNGEAYKHCGECHICVKPNYIHCFVCRRCTQKEGHNCTEYQRKIRCWICREVGHNEFGCKAVRRPAKLAKKGHVCLICRKAAQHNEKSCPRRRNYLHENSFMGQRTLTIKRLNKK